MIKRDYYIDKIIKSKGIFDNHYSFYLFPPAPFSSACSSADESFIPL